MPKEKLRSCVLALLCWEHVRASRGGFSVEALGPWMLTVLLHAVNASATSMDALAQVTHVVLTAEHSRKFLEMVANVIELSYQHWWSGAPIGFATDNYNEERNFYNQSLAKKNTLETNRLQQACAPLEPSRRHRHTHAVYGGERRACPGVDQAAFSIAFKQRPFWFAGPLSDFGWATTPIEDMTADTFGIFAPGDARFTGPNFFSTMLDEYSFAARRALPGARLQPRRLPPPLWHPAPAPRTRIPHYAPQP